MTARRCSRTACQRQAVCTLTYVYADQTAVLGPLATYAEPHAYDLCEEHAERLSAPRGWEVVRLAREPVDPQPKGDDLLALADAVREAARPPAPAPRGPVAHPGQDDSDEPGPSDGPPRPGGTRRGHLRVLTSE
ncbi:hypothetical protein J2S40_003019 [Nocardioides luteus]|uniref:DUF3499 domain-containing protein n=1 Tax=Nocardioides luteus TaxID=1844 RepID=A0ABQ5SXJ8_9ACTN|nr:hypothetical protein [Nocardioides luteus]GGR68411.1 hypothetical protein GCM10010197_39860 [Nocardioides luteus]GLJ68204.1 hypothetical protein GCM10017579_22400 [Nocardioides luteus]